MEITYYKLPTDKLKPDERNARLHDDRNLEAIKASLAQFGQTKPILVQKGTGRIIAGNGTYEAAAGVLDKIACRLLDVDDRQADAIAIADNKTADLAEWDEKVLADLLYGLEFELQNATGFSADEIATLLGEDESGGDAPIPEPPGTPRTLPGTLYTLGRHRLICGDSTDAEIVDRLLQGEKPGLMVTDPPYGVDYDPSWRHDRGINKSNRTGLVQNDERCDWREAWALFSGDVVYVWHAGLNSPSVFDSIVAAGFDIRAQIIWDKMRLCIGRGAYHWQHEPAWYGVRKGKKAFWGGDRTQTTVWGIAMVTNSNQDEATKHGTQKPIECMARPIRNHDFDGVYDPFMGSGTTIIAAEKEKVNAWGCELDPGYCDVIIERYAKFMGIDADEIYATAEFAEAAEVAE